MKKMLFLLILLPLISGCGANISTDSPESTNTNRIGVSDRWNNFNDLSGGRIDFADETVKSFNLNYSVGWSMDDVNYKKIYKGDMVGGSKVINIESNYCIQYLKDSAPTVICDANDYTVSVTTLSGIIVVTKDGTGFYPYNQEGKESFLFLCENDADTFRKLEAESFLDIEGRITLHIQPIMIILDQNDILSSISKTASASADDNATALEEVSKPMFFDADIRFSTITFTTFSQGEGGGIYGTRANGLIDKADDIAINYKL